MAGSRNWIRAGLPAGMMVVLLVTIAVSPACSYGEPVADDPDTVIQWSWKNRITGLSANIDHVWLAPKRMDTDTTAYMFTDKQERAVLIFGVEEYPDMDLQSYVDALVMSNAGNMDIPEEGEFGSYRGYPAWVGHGNLVKNNSYHVTVRVVDGSGAFWRTIMVQAPPKSESDDMIYRHEERVWDTIMPALQREDISLP